MDWIYICLYFMVIFVHIHGKPYSIHVSIHYPKGNKRPEIFVTEGQKGSVVKDVQVVEESGEPPMQPKLPPNPEMAQPVFAEDQSNTESESKMLVPTETERYHLKKSMQGTNNDFQNEINIDTEKEAMDLENMKQDDHRPEPHHRRHRKKHLKETYWNYKNMPPAKKNFRPPPPRQVHAVKSSQTYDMDEVKAYERIRDKRPPRPDEIEYKQGAVEEPGPEPRQPVGPDQIRSRSDYEETPSPNGRGPAEKYHVDEEKETYDRADDFESYNPFRNKKEHDANMKTVDYKSFDPYHQAKEEGDQGYKDVSIVKGCTQVGQMMPNPDDRCGYLECVHAEEQHYTKDLVAQQRKCAPGTAVPHRWRGGLDNPCTEAAAYCKNIHEVEDIDEEALRDEALHDEPSETKEGIQAETES